MTISTNPPKVTIITATYNWSKALSSSIQSALLQTFTDFELLVVGDGCTDDSEAVVLGFKDPRVRWMNLASNSGSQAVPNNTGIERSVGAYIAYLGHDDLWFPTHLESLVTTIERMDADLVGAATILYGPPDSGVLGMTGVFATGEWSKREFLPPSSLMHRKELVKRIGPWKEPMALAVPTDVEFQQRAWAAGAKFVSSNQLTVFKFNAAWRRNSYLEKAVAEQEEMLSRIRSVSDFRLPLLIEVVRAFHADKYVRIEAPEPGTPGATARYNASFKGTARKTWELLPIDETRRFYLDNQLEGFEWHGLEQDERGNSFRWSGPSRRSTLEFPVRLDRKLSLRVHIVLHLQQEMKRDVRLLLNGQEVESTVELIDGTWMMRASLPPATGAAEVNQGPLRLSFLTATTQRPYDLGMSGDRRWLGIAVNWVEFAPWSEGPR
jgi:hypothetical protein